MASEDLGDLRRLSRRFVRPLADMLGPRSIVLTSPCEKARRGRTGDVMPDVVILDRCRNRLLLVGVYGASGPFTRKREELVRRAFEWWHGELVLVSAFGSRRHLAAYLGELATESWAWFADEPRHVIVFGDAEIVPARSRGARRLGSGC